MKIPESFKRHASMLALALPMVWLAALRLCVLDGGESCYDAYYHADGPNYNCDGWPPIFTTCFSPWILD